MFRLLITIAAGAEILQPDGTVKVLAEQTDLYDTNKGPYAWTAVAEDAHVYTGAEISGRIGALATWPAALTIAAKRV